MISERSANTVVVWAPAKLNLFLEVTAKRPDGYHDLETLMVAVSLYDTLEFADDPAGAVTLSCDRPELSCGPDNLVVRAAELLRRRTGCANGARMRLTKRIPLAAGLAGGSSDAAATLAGLNRLWRLGLANAELAALGAEIGSDVSFFFATPSAWCTGRGEVTQPLAPGRPLWFVLACPSAGLSTARVFGGVTVPNEPVRGDAVRAAFAAGDADELGRRMFNRLQEPAERLEPAVPRLRGLLATLGPAGCLMSGSGSTVFALARDRANAVQIARRLRAADAPDAGTVRVGLVRSCV
jgi:4-diphosphocytidyl-2-C-methyl-D-erythritol kinase